MLEKIATQPASAQDPPPHPVSLYTFKAPNGVGVPAPHFYAALRFTRLTGGLPRPIITQQYGSRAAVVKTHAPFSCSITVPAPHRWVPAPHFFAVFRFPRRRGGFPRPTFLQHCGSRAARVGSRAPFLCSITVPAPHGWIPAPHFYAAPRRTAVRGPRLDVFTDITVSCLCLWAQFL
jgi:hypothetical protein